MECSLELAVDLVNTLSVVTRHDHFQTPADLTRFLAVPGVSCATEATGEDLEQVRRLRSSLRRVFEAPDGEIAAGILNGLLARAGARPELTNHDGDWHLHYRPLRTPLASRIAAETAMALSVVMASEGFERLRMCEGERYADVFVDRSRSRSRRFCSPKVCGNRAAVAAYRARRTQAGAG